MRNVQRIAKMIKDREMLLKLAHKEKFYNLL